MKNIVTNKIKLLKDIKPAPDWLKSQRNNLLLEISESGQQAKKAWSLPGFLFTQSAFKPVAAFCLLLLLVFGGGFFVVQGAKGSLPGDLLYPVKITLENAKMKISAQTSKPELEAEFVGNRMEELSQIIEEVDDPIEKKKKVVKAVDKLQAQVVSVKARLDKVKIDEPEKAAEVTDRVNEKLTETKKAVEKISDALAIILDNKEKTREITLQIDIVEFIEPPIVELEEFLDEEEPAPMNEASESFENLEDEESH